MSDLVILTAVIVLIAILAAAVSKALSFLKYRSEMNRRFPGPPASLFFGNTLELIREGGFTENFFNKLHDKYGDVVRFWLMGDLNLSVRNPRYLAEVHAKAPMRPRETKKIMAFLGDENLLFMEDMDEIKPLRERFIRFLNNPVTRNRLIDLVEERLEELTGDWDQKEVDVFDTLSDFLYHLNGTIFFGDQWMKEPLAQKIYHAHEIVLEQYTRWSMVPFPAWYNADYRKFRKATTEWWKSTEAFVDKRRTALGDSGKDIKTDLLAALLTARNENGDPAFTRHQIASHVIGILNGSFDTTRATLTWSLVRLAENPDIQSSLRRDIQEQIRLNPDITTFELSKLEIVDAALKESMRLVSTVPVLQRVNYDEELELGPYRIPKGVTINMAYQQAFQVPDPFEAGGYSTKDYCPARFMGSNTETHACKEAHKPFGSGPRQCVGNIYARVEIRAALIFLLQRFDIALKDSNSSFPRETVAGALQPGGPVELRFSRLNAA